MDKGILKFYAIATPIAIAVAVLMVFGITYLTEPFIDDGDKDKDDTWPDFADKSNQYTDYMVEELKEYEPGVIHTATSARIVYTSGDVFNVNVSKNPTSLGWYYLYADDKGIMIEYHTAKYNSTVLSVDKVVGFTYIPYESVQSIYVNNLPSES